MPLGVEVGLGPGHIVLDGDPAPPPKWAQPAQFSVHVCCGQRLDGSRYHLVGSWASAQVTCKMGTQFPLKGAQH